MSHDHQDHSAPETPPSPRAILLRNLMYGALAVLVVLNFFIRPHEPHFGLDAWPGFWALFGVAIAIILGRVAKGAAHTFLGKDEDYYDRKM